MPPKIKTTKSDIIDAVMEIIDESGYENVTARSVAGKLGISTQPIYREFKDMTEVENAAIARGWETFTEYIKGDALDSSVRYVEFAANKPHLFNFLFRCKRYEYNGLDELSHKLVSEDIIDRLVEITGLPREKVYRLHLLVWMALHGLAAMSADNRVHVVEGEIKTFTYDLTRALTKYYK